MKALVLSGGGAKGAFQAGVLQRLVEKGHEWDIIAGVSVGALNGSFIAQFNKDEQKQGVFHLIEFWKSLKGNHSVYRRWFPFGEFHSLWKGGLYDTTPLEKLVYKNVSSYMMSTSNVRLSVGAVCIETGQYTHIDGKSPNIREWILASAAFPGAFPPRKIDGLHWFDGGVRNITPINDIIMTENLEQIDIVLTSPLDKLPNSIPSKSCGSVINVGMRAIDLMSNEIFRDDLLRLDGNYFMNRNVYAPSQELHDPLCFDPKNIQEMLELGMSAAG